MLLAGMDAMESRVQQVVTADSVTRGNRGTMERTECKDPRGEMGEMGKKVIMYIRSV